MCAHTDSAPSSSREQRPEQLHGLPLLGGRQRLEPGRLKLYLVIDHAAQQHQLAAAARQVRIGHSVVGAGGGPPSLI